MARIIAYGIIGPMQIFRTLAAATLVLLVGCTTFEATRTQRFVDDANQYVQVEYASEKEPRVSTFTLSNGVRLPFRSKLKVRVELPDGTRFVAYQRMSEAGNLYMTENDEYKYFEMATGCLVARRARDRRGYVPLYQGVLCASVRNPMAERKPTIRDGGSTPQGFGRDSSGPRTVEQK